MTRLSELRERIEGANGRDAALDDAIWWHFRRSEPGYREQDGARQHNVAHHVGGEDWRPLSPYDTAPPLTASIDAALALVERKLPGWQHACGNCGEEDMPWACLTEPEEPYRDFAADEPAICLAILCALLKALEHEAT